LAYLVRRLLENGANSSFVHETSDPSVPVENLLRLPQEILGTPGQARHPYLRLPRDLFAPSRKNSRGVELGHRASLNSLLEEMRSNAGSLSAPPQASDTDVAAAFKSGVRGFAEWSAVPVQTRAAILEKAANLLELRRGRFLHLLQVEGGKTLDDAIAELRESVDFCRYYAAEAARLLLPQRMPGPTGESNVLNFRPRGIFVAISPWNFPLAIFTGQIAAALAAGNTVIAKPAEQTPVIAREMVKLLHEAGVPTGALILLIGDGKIGAKLVEHPLTGGVVFTGSTEVARSINRALAVKDGPIVPLIAETGGINVMIVDATALPEQVADDVMRSAFQSAGQRCSALRLLCLQEDVADAMLEMIVGAARLLKVGNPHDLSVKVGPVIDAEAKQNLDRYIADARSKGRVLYAGEAKGEGYFVAPHIIALDRASELSQEVFGPILHIVRFKQDELEALLDAIAGTGYGLTLGIHSRIQHTAERIIERLSSGNVYVNRNMIGAVVGVQPFGGHGLSGTGPKAGGPNYLSRFMTEQTVTTNTAAAGGNAELLALDESQ
jgi:RHH-type transcriptional regulator, proline utilization regulon repressor / proline dehydrogenase / delta 1-pyrroline-5-carboxylate dehydrogenase